MLENGETLEDYKIHNQDTIHLVPRLGCGMHIYVNAKDQKTIALKVDKADTIESVKQKIQDQKGIPTYQQHLIFDGLQLDDEKILEDYNLIDGSILHMELKLQTKS
ncbi:MAG: putative ubiquitin 3 [Streblomastix strix]|uniref:Putative ubiquitin 3 n=1 Tax=Streblomastix strix TaxID=222440 RepID=A0A5J4UVP1_9EUKA|nr:MAG: putative ubiquitin 3 [Streblomastix strix]